MVNAPSAVSRRRRHGSVAHDLAVEIIAGRLAPGDTLPNEEQLSGDLGVSRTALREAIRILGAKGFLHSRPRTGTRINPRARWNMLDPDVLSWHFEVEPSAEFIASLFELRRIVEPEAAALGAERRGADELERMRAALGDMGDAPTGSLDGLEADLAFHHAVLVATGNEHLLSLSSVIGSTLRWSVRLTLDVNPFAHRNSLPEHQAVFDAIAQREPDRARSAMSLLVRHALGDTLEALRNQGLAQAAQR
jgi:DNA-binding FadR family transcriptional regulator